MWPGYRDALADFELIHAGPEGRDGTHIFVPRRPVLVERQAALDHRRGAYSMISRSVAQMATASTRTRISALLGTGTGFSTSFNSFGSPNPGAHDLSDRHRAEVLTFGGEYICHTVL